MHILLQRDEVCLVEKRTVLQAWATWPEPSPTRLHASLADLEAGRFAPSCHGLWVPVGSVEFCRAWMRTRGMVEPAPLDYPQALQGALGRRVVQLTEYAQAPQGWWVKPVRTKAWAAHRKGIDPRPAGSVPPTRDENLWASEPLELQAEWRVYVLQGSVLGLGRYDDGPDELDALEPQARTWAQQLARAWSAQERTPAAYALDVARTAQGEWALVEVTDAWAIGYYRGSCSAQDYLRLLSARWQEICSV